MREKEIYKAMGKISENEKELIAPLVKDVCFLEDKLDELKKYPFIAVNPNNNVQQRTTPAAKQYKEMLQQYINCLKVLISFIEEKDEGKESLFRKWITDRQKNVV